jgi:uncharacterized coiled-coil protein SlyX
MVSLFLFTIIVLLVAAGLITLGSFNVLLNPFATRRDTNFALTYLFVLLPALLIGAYHINTARVNYCPPLEPIAAPDFAQPDFTGDVNKAAPDEETFRVGHDAWIFSANNSLADHIAELEGQLGQRDVAIHTAHETIAALQDQVVSLTATIDALKAQVATLQKTRIKDGTPTPTPIRVNETRPHCPKSSGCGR